MEVYQPKPLAADVDVAISNIALRALSRNLAIVVGAGVSQAAPTCLPLSPDIARKLKQGLRYTPLGKYVEHLPDDDFVAITDIATAQSADALQIIRSTILNSFDFKTAEPNYAHLVIALLMAEAGVHVLSTNWDTCIERAANAAYSDVVACRLPQELHGGGTSALLLKIHGCAEVEGSILVSSHETAQPPWWVTHQIGAAVERNWVVFLGIGSVAPYVRRTIETLVSMADLSSIWVVAPSLSQDWNVLLGNRAEERLVPLPAEDFLDGVIRALTASQFSGVHSLAEQRANESPLSNIDMESVTAQTISFLRQHPAHYLWLWVRRGAFPRKSGSAALDSTFVRSILAMALIHAVSPLEEVGAIGNVAFIRSRDFLVELAWARDVMTSDVLCQRKLDSLVADKRNNLLPQTKPILILVEGSVGPLPAHTMPESVVDLPSVADIIEGQTTIADQWISLDELLRIGSKDDLCELIGVHS